MRRDKLMMGIKYLDEITEVKNFNPKNINRLICFRGIIIRASEIDPEMKNSYFRCTFCREDISVPLDNAKVQEPV